MEGFERPCAFNKPRARIAGFRSPRCSRSFVSAIFLRENAILMKMSFISFFEYGAVHSASHPHRPVPVHIAEFSMMFQDCHETGLHEGLVNISLNGQAFETHETVKTSKQDLTLRAYSTGSLSHLLQR